MLVEKTVWATGTEELCCLKAKTSFVKIDVTQSAPRSAGVVLSEKQMAYFALDDLFARPTQKKATANSADMMTYVQTSKAPPLSTSIKNTIIDRP